MKLTVVELEGFHVFHGAWNPPCRMTLATSFQESRKWKNFLLLFSVDFCTPTQEEMIGHTLPTFQDS